LKVVYDNAIPQRTSELRNCVHGEVRAEAVIATDKMLDLVQKHDASSQCIFPFVAFFVVEGTPSSVHAVAYIGKL